MNGYDQRFPRRRFVVCVILTCVIIFTLGCTLFETNYWVHRLDDKEAELSPTPTTNNSKSTTDSSFGSKCLNSPGTEPCPIDACVAYKGEYTAKHVVTSELFGKANPSDYQCCAEFQFTNLSGVDLLVIEHWVSQYEDNWYSRLYPVQNPPQPGNCSNSFTRKDGNETIAKGVTEIIVLYDNPHCDWIEWDDPELLKYRQPVEAGCYSN